MSMWGWSASDLVQFARLAYKVFEYYQSAPQNLRQCLQRFQYVAELLEDLSHVLRKSGWRKYDRAPQLKYDLEEGKRFFDRYASLSAATSVSTSRLFDTVRLGLGTDKSKLRGIEENLKDHMEKMSTFKQDVILICSLRNLEIAQRLQAHSPGTAFYPTSTMSVSDDKGDNLAAFAGTSNNLSSSRLEADNNSVISDAVSVFNLATMLKKSSSTASFGRETRRFQPSPEPVLSTSPVLDALTASTERKAIDQFIVEIICLSEELQLYSENPSQPQSPQQLAKITSTAMKLCDSLQPPRNERTVSPRLTLPEIESPIQSFRDSILSSLSKYSNSTSITEWSTTEQGRMTSSPKFADRATSMIHEDSLRSDSVEGPQRHVHTEQTSTSISESGSFIMDIGPPAKQPLAFTVRLFEANVVGVASIECTLDFAEANENTPFCSITAIAMNQRRKSPSSHNDRTSVALTPQTHLDLPDNDAINDVRDSMEHRRIFHHKFKPDRRPFPHVLHPSVEGPEVEKDAPYTITFTVPQYFEEEGLASSPTSSTELKYIFAAKDDRDFLQSLIFGKFLRLSAGIKKVVTSGSTSNHCEAQQALRLWLSENGRDKSITVYFKEGKPPQKLYKEYHVHGLQSDPRKLKAGAAVKLEVLEEASTGVIDTRRRSSTTSAQTLSSKGSAESATSKYLTCWLHFSEDKERAAFLRCFN